MKQWFALHTRAKVEWRVAATLDRWDIETFVPVTSRAATEGRIGRLLPMFPGYLFIRIDLDRERTGAWLKFPGVRYIVARDNEPIPVTEEVIHLLRQKSAEHRAEGHQPQARFEPGALVRIREGPFRDMLAIFEGPSRPTNRVQVLLQALDRSMRLQLSSSMLDEVEADTEQRQTKRRRRTRGRGRRINYS